MYEFSESPAAPFCFSAEAAALSVVDFSGAAAAAASALAFFLRADLDSVGCGVWGLEPASEDIVSECFGDEIGLMGYRTRGRRVEYVKCRLYTARVGMRQLSEFGEMFAWSSEQSRCMPSRARTLPAPKLLEPT